MADVLPDHLRFERFRGTRLVLGVTGSVAAFRALDLLRGLRELGVDVGVTLTESAREFVTPLSFQALGADPVLTEQYPSAGRAVGDALEDPFAHLAPSRTADALCVAPASADFIARLALGRADDLLACQALAFSGTGKPLVVAPAMNPAMWAAPATQANWMTLLDRGVIGVGPCAGRVACGDEGAGRMSGVATILAACVKALSPKDMAGKKVLVNLGPTWERWDAVRFLSNPSTGKMGAAVAMAAWLRGAEVTAVCGPLSSSGDMEFPVSDGLFTRVDVENARQMREACLTAWESADMACMTAAVSDFAPVPWQDGQAKFKKPVDTLRTTFVPPDIKLTLNPDILAEMGALKRPGQRLVGFAAETGNLEAAARGKLEAKNLDLIVANLVNVPGHGFGGATNAALVLGTDDRTESWPVLPKAEMAWRIWDLVSEL